jgi:hypothetical protein
VTARARTRYASDTDRIESSAKDHLPHVFTLSAAERAAEYATALDRIMDAQREESAAHRAREPDRRSIHDYRAYLTTGLVCALVVKHGNKPASFECSRDGGTYARFYLPLSRIVAQPETTDDFLLVCLPKWLAQKAELVGVTLPLSSARPWTDQQRAGWDRLARLRSIINTKICLSKKRPASVLSRRDVA